MSGPGHERAQSVNGPGGTRSANCQSSSTTYGVQGTELWRTECHQPRVMWLVLQHIPVRLARGKLSEYGNLIWYNIFINVEEEEDWFIHECIYAFLLPENTTTAQ